MTATTNAISGASHSIEEVQICPLCSGRSLKRLPTPRRWIGREVFRRDEAYGLRRCKRCELAFVDPRPSASRLNAFYASEDYVCHAPTAGSAKTAEFLLECVARYGPYEGRRFLDFGCGGGFLLSAARDQRWDAVGFDVGERAIASCESQGLAVTSDIRSLARNSVDVIFLNHVFEHLAEPAAVLSECRRILGKNGKLFIVVPNLAGMRARLSFPFLSRYFNVDERYRAFPIHLFYYSPRTLGQTIEKNGFRIAGMETFGVGLDEFIDRAEVRRPAPDQNRHGNGKKTSSAFKRSVKRQLFGAGLGENLLAVASPV